ncbi:MAG: DNA/RNA helicase domain-containing protein [Chloroflexota bacterium]
MSEQVGRYGWASDFSKFQQTPSVVVRGSLSEFVRDASVEQVRAWDESIPPLQREVREVIAHYAAASDYYALLEYELPLESRRPDVVFLSSGSVFVLELKGTSKPTLAALDQASAYARDLRAYHAVCQDRPVHPILVLTHAAGRLGKDAEVEVTGIDAVDEVVEALDTPDPEHPIDLQDFLAPEAYAPLPTIVEAARELFQSRQLRRIWRAAVATEPALDAITAITHEAAQTNSRRLVILTGVPGAGKTLVGLQVAHARFLDDLAVDRGDGRLHPPAVYLSGNGPLVEVLQYEFRGSGGGGKAFVRDVKAYVERYTQNPRLVPDEHVLIYDEAQRAWDAERVADKHGSRGDGRSEPEHFIEFAERIPGWCVVLALVGQGQEIHIGEEAGLGQWRLAIERARGDWSVHAPSRVADAFSGLSSVAISDDLHLHTEIRFHLAHQVDAFVEALLRDKEDPQIAELAQMLERNGYHLRITRDLEVAKAHMRERYSGDPEARFGILVSARDKELAPFGVIASSGRFSRFAYGPWYVEGDDDPLGRSCRALREPVTEFGAQGLELDSALLAWGTDFIRDGGRWSNQLAKRYQNPKRIRDAFQLRRNAYRVLLTRGRDGTVVFMPPLPVLDETYAYLLNAGFRAIDRE